MSDDLVRRLREYGDRSEVELHEDREEAADRIEELEAALRGAVIAIEWWQDEHDCCKGATDDELSQARATLTK